MISALQKPGAVLEVTLQQDTDGKKDVTAEGILYLVGTPIGNMDDLSPRALSVLKSVDRILCEDTRITREFLSVYGIDQKLISCHDHNEREKTPDMISRLQDGARLALVSDAGMPLISDPGFHLVRAAREADIHVTSVPGPDAVTTALSVAGLPPDDFRFMGFLPRKPAALRKCLENIAAHPYTTVVYESAHRIEKTLNLVLSVLPHREMALCRNLTKFGEKVLRGSAADILSAIQSGQAINGELVLIIEGAPPAPSEQEVPVDPDMLNRMMETLIAADLPTKPLGDALAKALNIPRREGFNRILDLKRNLIN
jgi:16S rRNA (cytidine1402-2'-O)-methyltransferase